MSTEKKNTELAELIEIRSGVYSSTSLSGNAVYLQVGDLAENGELARRPRPNIELDPQLKRHQLKPGDILLGSKGNNNVVGIYDAKIGPALASSSFLILRVKPSANPTLLPEYLQWYLSNPKIQKLLKSLARGSVIPVLSGRALKDLSIPVPKIEVQRQIVALASLRRKEKELLDRINEMRDIFVHYSMIEVLEK